MGVTGRATVATRPSPVALAVKTRRVLAGLTQEQVADRTGGALAKNTISMIESGSIADPGITKILALAKVFECSISDLIESSDDAQEILDDAGVEDPERRRKGVELLHYWDELSEEQRPTALEIMKVLAQKRSP